MRSKIRGKLGVIEKPENGWCPNCTCSAETGVTVIFVEVIIPIWVKPTTLVGLLMYVYDIYLINTFKSAASASLCSG